MDTKKNDEARMSNDEGMTNLESSEGASAKSESVPNWNGRTTIWSFGFVSSLVIRISSFSTSV
jgi:hypothetical protein